MNSKVQRDLKQQLILGALGTFKNIMSTYFGDHSNGELTDHGVVGDQDADLAWEHVHLAPNTKQASLQSFDSLLSVPPSPSPTVKRLPRSLWQTDLINLSPLESSLGITFKGLKSQCPLSTTAG